MKQIPLTRGLFAFVDDDKFEFLNQWKWCALDTGFGFYAARHRCKGDGPGTKTILMHRVLLGIDHTYEGDHIDGNKLNNMMLNLRIATVQNNRQAFRTKSVNRSSKYRGVCFEKFTKRWKAEYTLNKKHHTVGRFRTEEEAARARDSAVLIAFGSHAHVNGV